jgi:hypothetical protein
MKKHDSHLEKGDIFWLPISDARPTQFCIGKVSAGCKQSELERQFHAGSLEAFLCEQGHLAPVVIGPGKQLYLTDHHHLTAAVWHATPEGFPRRVAAYVFHDWSDLDIDEFWRHMIEHNLAWLYDNKGVGPLHPGLLPKNVGDLLNDPYRTLSRWLRGCGCYTKNEQKDQHEPMGDKDQYLPTTQQRSFFLEFRWANFLRNNIKLELRHEDFSRSCAAMPYCSLYLPNEVEALKTAMADVIELIGCHALREVDYDQHGCIKR